QLFEQRINAGEWNGFLLFPQETTIGWDDYYFSRVNAILDTLQRYNNLDPDRIITGGLSSGGYGAMAHAQAYPKRVASIVASSPIYVNTLTQSLGDFVHIPLWIANGGTDINPDPYQVNSFVSAFLGAGGNCYQTYLADQGHNTWVFQWAQSDISNHDLLSGWWNKAHKAQPLVYYNNNRFCSGHVNARLGITPGYTAYEWQRDNGGGFINIAGAVTNEYQATQPGRYRVRFQRDATSGWSAWTPSPVNLTEKICTTDTLFAERFEAGNPFYYAATSYKPTTFDCQNGVFTSSTYNITVDGSGKTGGRFLLHNTNSGGNCTYTGNDLVWRATTPVTVTPNTNYEYCFYLANNSTDSNAKIVPAINGLPVTDSFVQAHGSGDGSWTKFRFTWNSGSNTAADLALFNRNSATAGNDFAIDEISFGVPGQSSTVLPANELLSFSAVAETGRNRLQWMTTNNSPATTVFYIEASPDGAVFHTIGSIHGSTGKSSYTFYDEGQTNATQYYRIQQITPNSPNSYSQVVAVRSGLQGALQVFPNPTNGGFVLDF
ncbi:MAG TPA: hypothetical protein VLD19_20820, partial [Chitinophagaceae bacterium]|nr:hypothetical protein [Chitinophagaceae bacterium]